MEISRRGFLSGLLATVAVEAIPFNRVWSFPKEIKIVKPVTATVEQYCDYLTVSDALNYGYIIHPQTLAEIYYDKHLVDIFNTSTPFMELTKEKSLPKSNKQIKFYNYTLENI